MKAYNLGCCVLNSVTDNWFLIYSQSRSWLLS